MSWLAWIVIAGLVVPAVARGPALVVAIRRGGTRMRRVRAQIEARRDEQVRAGAFTFDLATVAEALCARGRWADAAALLDGVSRQHPVVRLAVGELDRVAPLGERDEVVERAVEVPGLRATACDACACDHAGTSLRVRRDGGASGGRAEARCPRGHTLPGTETRWIS